MIFYTNCYQHNLNNIEINTVTFHIYIGDIIYFQNVSTFNLKIQIFFLFIYS